MFYFIREKKADSSQETEVGLSGEKELAVMVKPNQYVRFADLQKAVSDHTVATLGLLKSSRGKMLVEAVIERVSQFKQNITFKKLGYAPDSTTKAA